MSKDGGNGTGKKILAGALVAGAVGYVAGILTAPKSGKETRQDIKDTASRAMREGEKQLKGLHSELSDLLAEAKKKTGDVSGRSKRELTKLTNKAASAKEQVREVLSAIHEGDADDPDLAAAIKNANGAAKALGKYLKKR